MFGGQRSASGRATVWQTAQYMATASTKRILLVEYHRSLSDSLAYLLSRELGLPVVGQVVSAAECRRSALSSKGFDLVSTISPLAAPSASGCVPSGYWTCFTTLTGQGKVVRFSVINRIASYNAEREREIVASAASYGKRLGRIIEITKAKGEHVASPEKDRCSDEISEQDHGERGTAARVR